MKGLWVPVSAAISQQKQVDNIANNVANSNTAGFKKDQLVFREYLSALEGNHQEIDMPHREWKPGDFYRSYGAEKSMVHTDGSYTNFEQGQLTPTQAPFDLAIQGPGMFEVYSPSGGIRYTRKGQFSLNSDGFLVTQEGAKILKYQAPIENKENDPINNSLPSPEDRFIRIDPRYPITVNGLGEIFQNNQNIAKISIAEFKDFHALKKEGSSFFINSYPENLLGSNNGSLVLQGFIEESNVNPINEMANLIQAHRNFETIQRVIKTYDSIAGKGASEISRF